MSRWVLGLVLLLACSCKDEKRAPQAEVESEGERSAKAIRESFRVVIAEFHADVVAGKLDAAYERLAPMYRASVSPERFATVTGHPLFAPEVTFTTSNASISAGTAKVQMFAKGAMGTSQVELRCTLIDRAWKIAGISVDGTPVLPTPSP